MTDNTFKYIFLNENICIWIQLKLKCILFGPFDKKPALA